MRCNNCGWNNDMQAIACIKCNAPIDKTSLKITPQSKDGHNEFEKTISERPIPVSFQQPEAHFIKTNTENTPPVSENRIMGNEMLASCSKCGYLNAQGAVACAKCKTPLSIANQKNVINNNPVIYKDPISNDNPAENEPEILKTINNTSEEENALNNNSSFKGTIDPYRKSKEIQTCYFTPILREGEINKYPNHNINNGLGKVFKSGINPNQLNRANLDTQNLTITSKVQAELYYEDGNWFLQDKSELQTTFIMAKEKTALKEGDIVLMGDRKFIFSVVDK